MNTIIGFRHSSLLDRLCLFRRARCWYIDAGTLIKEVAPIIDGSGGGSPLMAQAGGTKPKGIDKAFKKLEEIVGKM